MIMCGFLRLQIPHYLYSVGISVAFDGLGLASQDNGFRMGITSSARPWENVSINASFSENNAGSNNTAEVLGEIQSQIF
jgi:hypothetical protein